jgi:uncharacterized membrane protein YfcA
MLPTTLASASPELVIGHFVLLVAVGALATAINTVAGGGSLISFPVLVALGIPSIAANATNAFALTLGGIAGAFGYLRSLRGTSYRLVVLLPVALCGGLAGAWLLLRTTERVFDMLVPALILAATILLALPGMRGAGAAKIVMRNAPLTGIAAIFAISIYGGYFGAGMGIAFLAILQMFVPGNLHNHNALKNWLQCLVNVVAASEFLMQGTVLILPGIALMIGGIVGGYAAAILSQRIDPKVLRSGIVGYGALATICFFVKAL